jgi:putative ABC transport system substrate-binding protein
MKRREFIGVLSGAALAWPLAARAQQPDRMRRVGILVQENADAESLRTELREGLRKFGYVEGQNIRFEVRSANEKLDLFPELAAELVSSKVDVIAAVFTPSALAAKRATAEIPIVFLAGDAVGTGVVASLARPGGNLTGLSIMGAELQAWKCCTTCSRPCGALLRSPTRAARSQNRSSSMCSLPAAPPVSRSIP